MYKNVPHVLQSPDVVERDVSHHVDVLLHHEFFVEKDAKVTHNTDWFDDIVTCIQRQVYALCLAMTGP